MFKATHLQWSRQYGTYVHHRPFSNWSEA